MRNLGISVLLIVALLFIPQVSYAAATPHDVRVQVKEALIDFPDAKPFIDNQDRMQVPLRLVSEQLGFDVKWEKKDDGIAVTLTGSEGAVAMTTGSTKVIVNGSELELDTTPYLVDKRVYVPLRFLSELSGLLVKWDKANSLAIVHHHDEQVTALWKAPKWKLIKNMKASAYSADVQDNGDYDGRDYMGNKLSLGTVAVDPKVIPLGSVLYIDGYDFDGLPTPGMHAVATDIGGAIKGNKIDIYIPGDRKNALRFGLRNVNVYVLEQ